MNNNDTMPAKWTFLTNHAHVLLSIAKSPSLRMRDLANAVGITERAVQRIVSDLVNEGYIDVTRDGRCNTYSIDETKHLKHPIESHKQIFDLLQLIYDTQQN